MALPLPKAMLALAAGGIATLPVVFLLPIENWTQGTLLSVALCWASAVDLDRQILPDVLTIGLCAFGLAYAFLAGADQLVACLIGAFVGYGSFFILIRIYLSLRGRPGMGMGDAKLLAAAGAWLGWTALPYVVLVASGVCLFMTAAAGIAGRQVSLGSKIAFGPFLAIAIWSIWLFNTHGTSL